MNSIRIRYLFRYPERRINKKVKGKLRTKTAKNGHFRKKRVWKRTRMRRHVAREKNIRTVAEKINSENNRKDINVEKCRYLFLFGS